MDDAPGAESASGGIIWKRGNVSRKEILCMVGSNFCANVIRGEDKPFCLVKACTSRHTTKEMSKRIDTRVSGLFTKC